jgi:hypothetical protein
VLVSIFQVYAGNLQDMAGLAARNVKSRRAITGLQRLPYGLFRPQN